MDNIETHVIFGTGPLGKSTARELLRLGKRVRMVNRSGRAEDLPEGAELIQADAYDTRQTVALTAGAAAVYQCAQPAYHDWVEKFPPLQAAILEGAAAAGAKLVVAENLYVYGRPDGPLTEDSPLRPHTRKGKVRLAMTRTLAEAQRAGRVRVAIARGSDFFGPGDTVSARLLFGPAVSGKTASVLGRVDQPHTYTYTADFGKTLATLGTRDEALGHVWHVPSNPAVTQGALIRLVEAATGRRARVMRASAPILWLVGLGDPDARELIEMLYEFERPFVMDSQAAQRAFGITPTPLPEAVRATVEWVRRSGAGA
ncbi:MAG TPA: NAD-dependent epimerase/dehydratase family protein [Ktedonobacterales bacterium]